MKTKSFSWYVKQAGEKRNVPQSILQQFRTVFSEIAQIELKNALHINFRLHIRLMEQLRHIIVHKGGTVSNKKDFIDQVLKKAGLANNGQPKQEYVDIIKSLFGGGEYENTIVLLEHRSASVIPGSSVNIFAMLTGHLMAYSHFLTDVLDKHSRTMPHSTC